LWNFEPHEKQQILLDHPARKKLAYSGRKGGKTTSGREWCKEIALEPAKYTRLACIAPTYKLARLCFDQLVMHLKEKKIPFLVDHSRTDPGYVRIKNFGDGTTDIFCRSTEDPDSLLGDKYDAYIDESARMLAKVWFDFLAPNIKRCFITTTPKGKDWNYDFYLEGQNPKNQAEWFSLSFDTFTNTKMPPEDYEALKKEYELALRYSPLTAKQEYMAVPVEGVDDYFHNIEMNIDEKLTLSDTAEILPPDPKRFYSTGVDLARFRDYTVVSILDDLGTLVYWKRIGHFDPNSQKMMIIGPARRYPGVICPDATGIGLTFFEELANMGFSLIGFHSNDAQGFSFSTNSRSELLMNLNIMLTDARLRFPRIPELLSALAKTGISQTEAGRLKIGASGGHLPDEVASLALAAWGLRGLPTRYEMEDRPDWTPLHRSRLINGVPVINEEVEVETEARGFEFVMPSLEDYGR